MCQCTARNESKNLTMSNVVLENILNSSTTLVIYCRPLHWLYFDDLQSLKNLKLLIN